MRRGFSLLLWGLCVTPVAGASIELPHFSVGGLVAFRGGSEVTSFVGAWTPYIPVGDAGAVRADLGTALLKDSLGDLFIGLHAEVLGVVPLFEGAVAWEIGGGAAIWTGGHGGLRPLLSTGFAFGVGGNLLDRVTATYSRHFQSNGIHWVRVTLGLRWSLFDGT